MKINLNGKWFFKSANDSSFCACRVPSVNYADLLENKLIPDPFEGMNESVVYNVAQKDWIYKTAFDVSEDVLEADAVLLCAEQFDTLAEITINGRQAFKSSNCHLPVKQDIKSLLLKGENSLEIEFHSPVKYAEEKQKAHPAPHNNNGQNGIVYIRKPQYHFGWDWGPVLPVSGISGDIYLQTVNLARIESVKIEQFHSEGAVRLSVLCETERYAEGDIALEAEVFSPAGELLKRLKLSKKDSLSISASDGEKNAKTSQTELYTAETELSNPQLWWTKELSGKESQPLYKIAVSLFKSNGAEKADDFREVKNGLNDIFLLDKKQVRIGLRSITLSREKDSFGRDFCFVLNGVRVFAKGANVIPPDSFITRVDSSRLDALLNAAQFANMNMLRVWGGGYYASDAFMDKCDERGILVWHDFAFACQPYPFFEQAFLDSVKQEITAQVKRLRNHASLALWCGNNEIEAMHAAWATRRKWIAWTEKFFYGILPRLLCRLDSQTPYIEGSPCGVSHNRGFDSDNAGDTHLWAVWHGLQPLDYYRKRQTRFCSEYGFESLPALKTVLSFANETDLSLDSPVLRAHQKCAGGNDKMKYYIASRFRLPSRFSDYIYLSQIMQSECVRDAAEHWRRNKGRSNGALFWQLNDCWPVCSWSSVDYAGRYKALQYFAKRFFQPAAASAYYDKRDKKIKVCILNDSDKTEKFKLDFYVATLNGKKLCERSVDVVSESGTSVLALECAVRDLPRYKNTACFAQAALKSQNGKEISRASVLTAPEKRMRFKKAQIERETTLQDGTLYIRLKAKSFARFVMLGNSYSDNPFSDNFFDLAPDCEYCVSQKLGAESEKLLGGFSQAELNDAISVFSVADLSEGRSALSDAAVRLRVLFKPLNFGSYLYYLLFSRKELKNKALSAPTELEKFYAQLKNENKN
jgi:beta-mannosidase